MGAGVTRGHALFHTDLQFRNYWGGLLDQEAHSKMQGCESEGRLGIHAHLLAAMIEITVGYEIRYCRRPLNFHMKRKQAIPVLFCGRRTNCKQQKLNVKRQLKGKLPVAPGTQMAMVDYAYTDLLGCEKS